MTTKYKIKGKTYTLVEVQDVGDPQIIKFRGKVKDSKGVEYTLIHSVLGYHLYDSKDRRYAESLSIQEWQV